jgi:hypothetical protein
MHLILFYAAYGDFFFKLFTLAVIACLRAACSENLALGINPSTLRVGTGRGSVEGQDLQGFR